MAGLCLNEKGMMIDLKGEWHFLVGKYVNMIY